MGCGISSIHDHNQFVLDHLEEGDLIQIERNLYSHWAVYIGDEKVIHLTGIDGQIATKPKHVVSVAGVRFNKAIVKEDNFWVVCGQTKVKKNNQFDKKYGTPLSGKEIIDEAKKMLGPVEYNALFNNCEHFATLCRYKEKESKQSDTFITFFKNAVHVIFGID